MTADEIEALRVRVAGLVDRSGGPDACWPYTGGSFGNGYPVIYTTTSAKTRRLVKMHRLVFELETGESPPSVDHLCHDSDECRLREGCPHRRCCNPAHLAASTVGANARRAHKGIHRNPGMCGSGRHPRTPENTYEAPDGALRCRPCDAERARDAREAARSNRPPPQRRPHRPRGMSLPQLVDWALGDQDGNGCWGWADVPPRPTGYVAISFGGRSRPAHAVVYEARVGPIPPGHVVDHTCHDPQECEGGFSCPHRACVNPAHLRVVTRGENSSASRSRRRRPEECAAGHPFTPENTYVTADGRRHCRTCAAARQLERHHGAKGPDWVDGRRRENGRCANGHDVAVLGVNKYGKCVVCVREKSLRYKAKEKAARAASAPA